ncbi:UvrD-helicase domain-containing protein [Oceanispirochaeta sp. M1]|uniref:UvrD-helicase domain-containing protein n=2 Tax=Oceanispirochaeta TaxID=2035349 RepID=UPI0014950884|nr:UvrD-helicase domain-containing protein [Oceanispirochaeta sp. M1]
MEHSKNIIKDLNNRFIEQELDTYETFFDLIEKNPLTASQRKACIIDQDNNLILAGAGTGKTSTMIGRSGYLIESKKAKADEILMIAFARKAATEMQDRISDRLQGCLKSDHLPIASTFHALGLKIISEVEGIKPSLSKLSENGLLMQKFIDDTVIRLSEDKKFAKKYVRFMLFYRYPCRLLDEFKTLAEYNKYVQENKLQTMNGEYVKSYEEFQIANFLFSSSIRYEYEINYKHNTASKDFGQYKPDFYLTDYGIYLEHFALDEEGNAPEFFNKNKEHTYEEGVEWKRQLHQIFNTTLIETYSYMQRNGVLLDILKEILVRHNVKIIKKSVPQLLKEINENREVSEFSILAKNFILLMKQTAYTFSDLYQKAAKFPDSTRLDTLLDLMEPIYNTYEHELRRTEDIDFSDMIRKATAYVSEGKYRNQYKHILVDEFQDISPARAGLVKSLIEQDPSISLFVVGDDWQSIYRFTGSDLNMMVNFKDEFGYTAKTVLDTTFRFNDQIGLCSSTFIQKNPYQLRKNLNTVNISEKPEVSTVKTQSNLKGLQLAVSKISQNNIKKTKVLVLARYHYLFNEFRESGILNRLHQQFSNVSIELMSIHASKGKEADYVILVGLLSDELPAEKPIDDILELLLPNKESYPYAEERRLFYVALTRAKRRVYLIFNPLDPSPFMEELESKDYNICENEIITGEYPNNIPLIRCPDCERGMLSIKKGKHGSFVGCSKYPMCRHTQSVCPFCDAGILIDSGEYRKCTNPGCNANIPICPKCSGSLLVREGKYGQFFGCSNYRGDDILACNYTRKIKSYTK